MRKIVEGLLYDTDKSDLLAEYEYSNPNDFNYVEERLYKTPNGRYFLYGEGGANTEYFEKVGNSTYSGGSTIIPLSIEKALEWAEKRNIEAEAVIEEFSDHLEEA